MPPNPDSEAALELATMELFAALGYQVINAEYEQFGTNSLLGRESRDEVVLLSRLYPALRRLNPNLPDEAIQIAADLLSADLSLKTLADANQYIYVLLKDGLRVTYRDEYGAEVVERLRVIDWNAPENNDWLAVQQFWMMGLNGLYKRRADVVLFINGLPLVLIELKASHKNVENAYRHNLSDYKDTVPQLFWYNAFIILSNGRYSRMGSMTANWEHFSEWKRISSEGEAGRISLETILLGTCEPSRLLDLIENFTLFELSHGRLNKLVARNHQFLGVNAAIENIRQQASLPRQLGVFWHTQGSGKSYSMVFFSQKILRKLPGNWRFVIVTDRKELDSQIYDNFAGVGAVPSVKGKKREVQAQNSADLQRLLAATDTRYVFTLIQKFRTPHKGAVYPVLSERDDIIVMTDEAHRSQYDIFAMNMRRALPNAGFIGFTGTPLMAGEEKTKQEFGDYISTYDFKQSVDDGATVPLFYENRIPFLKLVNPNLNADMEALLEAAELDDEHEAALEREFHREYQLITRQSRLETIAADIVAHYSQRGLAGQAFNSKAMVVSIDKLTAVKMYHLVQQAWALKIATLEAEGLNDPETRALLDFMRETDMAVIISQDQNEMQFFRKNGFDILPHRERMVKEALDEKFKNPQHPLRLVFVCAMWMTGFDAPACATIYLDRPMRNHTLMQTIARANRVYKSKQDGLIVDYIGVFRNLEEALAIYGKGSGGSAELPIQPKEERIAELRNVLSEALNFCYGLGIDLDAIDVASGFTREGLKNAAIEAILSSEESKARFFLFVRDINRLFKSILPDVRADEFSRSRQLFVLLAEMIQNEIPHISLADLQEDFSSILDESVIAETYTITGSPRRDISQLDFDALKAQFDHGYKRTAIEKLRGNIQERLEEMLRRNRTRMDYQTHFQQMIERYNAGSALEDVIFEELLKFVDDLDAEAQRGMAENLNEEELAIFDLLTKPQIDLSPDQRKQIKQGARQLLESLKAEKLTLDWRKHQSTRAAVKASIQTSLDVILPQQFDQDLYEAKVIAIYQHVYESYFGEGRSLYAAG